MNEPASRRETVIIGGSPLPERLDEDMVHDGVHGFYDAIRKDDLLGPIFLGIIPAEDWPRHLGKMCDFWSATPMGPSALKSVTAERSRGTPRSSAKLVHGVDSSSAKQKPF